LYSKYFYYYLQSIKIGNLGYARHYKLLKANFIAYPTSIKEQEEIVEKLDKGFELIDSLKETAKKNLDNAKELFQSVLREELSPKEGWEAKTLGKLCIIAPQKKEVREKLNDNDLVTFLPMEDLGIMQKNINPQKTKLLSEVINGYTYFAENDILLAKVTPCFENGKLGIAKNLCNQIGFGSSEYIVLRAKDIKSEYIYYNLSSESFRNNGKKLMIGACGLKRLPKDYVNNFEIHFPESSKEQEEIVGRLDRIKGYCEELEGNYKRVLELCEELKQGLLREVFEFR
jgi:type I restriction enzyme S subunit